MVLSVVQVTSSDEDDKLDYRESISKNSTADRSISQNNTVRLEAQELRKENLSLREEVSHLKEELDVVVKDIKMLNTVIRIPHLCSEFLKAVKK